MTDAEAGLPTRTSRSSDYVVLALIAAAALFLIGSLLQAFNEPIGLGEFTGHDSVLLRVRAAADNANGLYVGVAAVAVAALGLVTRARQALRALAAVAGAEAVLTVYVFVYDAINRHGTQYFRIRRFSDGCFRLASLVVAASVAAWAWERARGTQ